MNTQIKSMLTEAYYRLGVKRVKDIDDRVREALDYLQCDRERYIEAAEPGTPECSISVQDGVIGHLIPLARSIETDEETDFTQSHTTVLALLVTEDDARYLFSYTHARLYAEPRKNTYSYPVCLYAWPEEINDTFQVLSPQEITPAATPLERELFGMIFVAIAKFGKKLPINYIPHKTERAMLAAEHARQTQLTVDGKPVTGRVILLASQHSMQSELREDHRYSYKKELCLLVTEEAPRYLLKVHHVYRYFRKVIYDDAPGGCACESTGEKQEITWHSVALEDIREDLDPLYY